MQYLKIIITLFFILYAKVIYAFVGQFLSHGNEIYYQIIAVINLPYAFFWIIVEDLAPFLMHDVVQQWQLNFLIPGGILMDIGLLILAYLLIYGVFWLIDYLRGWRTKDGLEQRDIVLSLTFIIPGLILNYILGWIAHFINYAIS